MFQAEVNSISDQTNDRAAYLRLTRTPSTFMTRCASAQTLDMAERERIVRLLVNEVLVGDYTITSRHSITVPAGASSVGERDAGCQRPTSGSAKVRLCVREVITPPCGISRLPLAVSISFRRCITC